MRMMGLGRQLLVFSLISFACAEDSKDTAQDDEADDTSQSFVLESSVMTHGGDLPDDLKCVRDGGDGKSPPLSWSHAPSGTKGFAVVMYHYPQGATPGTDQPNHYWLLWNIGSSVTSLSRGNAESIGAEGSDKDGKRTGYTAPCSPVGSGTRSYTLRISALSDEPTALGSVDSVTVGYADFMAVIQPLTLESAELTFSETN